jgi:selenophosphate synthase
MKEDVNLTELVIDSGSDITLISEAYLKKLDSPPKVRTGQRINLVQLTGATAITGYVNLPVFFHTMEGTVRMDVEAYVVKGMTAPAILGNDFAEQFDLSLVRQEGKTRLVLGGSNRSVEVENSTSPFLDDSGKFFKVRTIPEAESKCYRIIAHKHNKRLQQKHCLQSSDPLIRAGKTVTIPPETVKNVPVSTANLDNTVFHYAE